ncbi:hypothetical protein [Dictyobacter formicarum]|uniref:Uncharacterized protein n=1 Tax=Dictyobacter formicarum TaxID=2778368 RepID=A0ABQ3VPQ0_9CHLR|nr:hypothetical protein [Dictyobacter formicarum]GHO88227.1 hypothetical protein KSZ_62330 [Dictyobacter formicarum]
MNKRRKPWSAMSQQERADWLAAQQAELEDFCSYAHQYIKDRERRGRHTRTDDRYQQFFVLAADLLRGLEEIRQEAEQKEEQTTQSSDARSFQDGCGNLNEDHPCSSQ